MFKKIIIAWGSDDLVILVVAEKIKYKYKFTFCTFFSIDIFVK